MSVHNPAIVALVRLEWAGVNYQQEPCCPECSAPLYGKNSAVTKYALETAKLPRPPWVSPPPPYYTLEPGSHFPHCLLDEALRTQEDLQTPQAREIARRESYPENERRRHEYIKL